jgi:hypothetical protein
MIGAFLCFVLISSSLVLFFHEMEERLSLGLHCAGGMEAAGARQASGERPATYHKNGSGRKENEKENEKKRPTVQIL